MTRTLITCAAFLLVPTVGDEAACQERGFIKGGLDQWRQEQEQQLEAAAQEHVEHVKSRLGSLSSDRKREFIETAEKYAIGVAKQKNAAYYRELGDALLKISGKGEPTKPSVELNAELLSATIQRTATIVDLPDAPPELPTKNLPVPEERAPEPLPPVEGGDLTQGLPADPVWQRNFDKMLQMPSDIVLHVFAGFPVKDLAEPGLYRPCVAIGNADGQYRGSGVLIGPNVVLTAAHVVDFGFKDRVFIGLNVSKPDEGRVVEVAHARKHDGYSVVPVSVRCGAANRPYQAARNDIAVLILKEKVADVTPLPIATKQRVLDHQDAVGVLRGVGYGLARNIESGLLTLGGIQCTTLLPIGSASPGYHCDPTTELVAGDGRNDMCAGDSGGPLLIEENGSDGTPRFLVAAIVSRGLPCSGACSGGGGVNTLAPAHIDWIRSVAAEHGGELAVEGAPRPDDNGP